MSVESSPDPLSILADDYSPVRPSRERKGALAPRSANINSSPTKSMVLETKNADGGSPWRIRVTVQAEPTTGSLPINRAVKIPLRDAETSPVRLKSRSRKPNATSPARKEHTRKPTPTRHRISQSKPKEPMQEVVAGDETILSDSGVNAYFDHDDSPERPTKTMDNENFQQEQETEAVLGAYAPGDATMMESEEFSMISVDSLTSNNRPGEGSSPAPPSNTKPTSERHLSARDTNVSFMPSSPPVFLRDRVTPAPTDSPPQFPPAPVQQHFHEPNVATPMRESAKKLGQALQHALNGPFRESVSSSMDPIFATFSAGTRRQLRESLNIGQGLASHQQQPRQPYFAQGVPSLPPSAPTVLSPFQSPIRKDSINSSSSGRSRYQNRMLTPDSHDREYSVPTSQAEGEVQYPSLTEKIQQSHLASPYHGYDDMSWMATGPVKAALKDHSPVRINEPLIPLVNTQEEQREGAVDYSLSEIEPELVEPDQSEEEEQADDGAEDQDIWQEEASRDLDETERPSNSPEKDNILDDELPIKPRRSKLPGTWRRISGANFHYSDSPEPEEIRARKVSATTDNSSRKTSGVLTPPATEDESCIPESVEDGDEDDEDDEEESQVEDAADLESVATPSETGESVSSNASPDEDDTGMFWHANLPAVYRANERPPLRNSRFASLAALKDNTESSPLRNTVLDISPMKAKVSDNKMAHAEEYEPNLKRRITKAPLNLSSPLRRSLLKSSKMPTSPLGKVPAEHSISEESIDQSNATGNEYESTEVIEGRVNESSMASDARQLHNELTRGNESSMASDARQLHTELRQTRPAMLGFTSTIDLTEQSLTVDESQFVSEAISTRSYQEELNRDSPTRIRVNFNDSMNSSLIAPRKDYPPLFDALPNLKPTSSESASSNSVSTTHEDKTKEEGVVARLASSFWDVVTAPPVYVTPAAPARIVVEPVINESARPTTPDLTLRLRRKYGLLPDRHPFTYTHIRTLHRMLNSTRSRPEKSIISTSGPLSSPLAALVGTKRTNELDQQFVWTEQNLYVVSAFCSLLLPASERARLEEIKPWGDSETLKYKGVDSKGRHGCEKVFPEQRKGKIEETYVADVLVGIVLKEEMNTRKERVREMMKGLESSEAGPFS